MPLFSAIDCINAGIHASRLPSTGRLVVMVALSVSGLVVLVVVLWCPSFARVARSCSVVACISAYTLDLIGWEGR